MTTTSKLPLKDGMDGFVSDWASDQRAFKGVPWGKAMMWIFLLSDTFIFSIFLISYMTARWSTVEPWPNTSEVFFTNSQWRECSSSTYSYYDIYFNN
jgi:cytochrome c oxidase subunit 3